MGTLLFLFGAIYAAVAIVRGRRQENLSPPPVLSKG